MSLSVGLIISKCFAGGLSLFSAFYFLFQSLTKK